MSKSNYILSLNICLLLTLLVFICACDAQSTPRSKNSPKGKEAIKNGAPKIVKNHFIPGLSEDFFFVQCGLQDKKGNMWFGTAGNGIYVYNGNSFVNFTHKSFINFFLKNDLNHNDILCCLEDKTGNIWFGTRRGVIRYTPSKGQAEVKDFTLFLIPENIISKPTQTRLPYTFKTGDNFVWSIMQDKTGKIWFGTSKGIYTHNPSTDNDNAGPFFTRFLDDDSLINNKQLQLIDISVILQDRKGNIWFASAWSKGEGIVRYDGKSLVRFTPDNINSFRSIIETEDGGLLLLSPFNGVYLYDGETFSNLNKKMGLKSDTLVSMLKDKNGNLWLGHNSGNVKNGGDGGLWCYDGKSLKLFTTKDGLSHNHVMCMIADRNGNLWFGTRNTGLCRYDGRHFTDFTDR